MSARRWAALGTAAAITLLSVSGALGVGPGAAFGEPPGRTLDSNAQTKQPKPDGASDDRHPSASDDWLTVEEPATDPKSATKPPRPSSTELPARSGTGKRVVFAEKAQRVWLVGGNDKVVRTYLVSGAKDEDLLDPGRYRVYSKSRDAVSFDHKETMNYMVRFTTGDHSPIGFHDVPAYEDGMLAQSRTQLGTPTSAGCIRQWISDARALWDFAPVGTRVVVTA